MTAAVRKKDEELTTDLKCMISVLMTCSGLYEYANRFSEYIKSRSGMSLSGSCFTLYADCSCRFLLFAHGSIVVS